MDTHVHYKVATTCNSHVCLFVREGGDVLSFLRSSKHDEKGDDRNEVQSRSERINSLFNGSED